VLLEGIEIVGRQEEIDKITKALQWLGDFVPSSKANIASRLKRILCAEAMRTCVFSAARAVVLNPEIIKKSGPEKIANCLMRATSLVEECESTGKCLVRHL
jgi:hypothetical protein